MSLKSVAEALAAKIDDVYNAGYEKGAAEGGTELPEEAFVMSGECTYRFAYNGWNWFIEKFGEKITVNCTEARNMFYQSTELKTIPFSIFINPASANCVSGIFSGCANLESAEDVYIDDTVYLIQTTPSLFSRLSKLKKAPKIHNLIASSMYNAFLKCENLKLDDGFFDGWDLTNVSRYSYIFSECKSIRKIPVELFEKIQNTTNSISYNNSLYYSGFYYCYALDELVDIPVFVNSTFDANAFYWTFTDCWRVKDIVFQKSDDYVYVVNWKNQIIDLSGNIGLGTNTSSLLSYNSGITNDKLVTNAETYQNLKNDPDWYTIDIKYSRYNHDSAVRTINSLPDTSAYLATAGGTNTIKFRGAAGSATDGGAINTLTEEEIAVATAKGWTVTY